MLKDFDFNQWDKDFTMIQLHSKYSVNLFFKINVVPDDRAAGKYIIQVFWNYIICSIFCFGDGRHYTFYHKTISDISIRTGFARSKILR